MNVTLVTPQEVWSLLRPAGVAGAGRRVAQVFKFSTLNLLRA